MNKESVTEKKKPAKGSETIEEIVDRDDPTEKKINTRNKKGVVFNCLVLNVRKEPSSNGPVEATIPKWTEVTIDESKSNKDFYSITTESGITGFCNKQFIKAQ